VEIFSKIKNAVGQFVLNKELPKVKRERNIINLDDARTIGIIYILKDEQTYNQITQFVKYLQDKQISIKAIGYFDGNIRPIYAIEKLSLDFYDRKDINWYGKPSGNYVNEFLKQEFDILIDLTLVEFFPTKYISALSRAKFKVGKGGKDKEKIFDFMIKLNDDTTLDEYISLVTHYLEIINKKNYE
jgi:hypothetical protein